MDSSNDPGLLAHAESVLSWGHRMSDRTINYYEFPEREPDWAELKQRFKSKATVGEALIKAGANGCDIVPTDSPNCCQLRITAETAGPVRVGHARMGKRCPVCGVAKMFISSSERYFHRGDLKRADFQICRLYAADNVGQFEILNGFPIASQRIFNVLLKLKIRGLDRYSTDPPIRHAVVQCRDV